ncbi:ABC transporter substrate-binding protein [Devosia sp. YIM 151766]|uniref:ABC transporter substrate-binding protein n=1 Tax=Devosia sp. YIM 151766 TaxID=3017325 RepID=UPI00255C58D3|nr:ABC transporter substrate-binding protein [Devosia sp. YIM 151766]WIY53134.1 ABC transporter substrate-binding protein [Devosia sp. YIM 151766]
MTALSRTIFGFMAAASLLPVSTAFAMAAPFRLIVTHLEPPLVPNSVMDLAVELGYFEREGVDVELVRVQQTPSALAALRAGEGEMANIGVDALLLLRGQGVTDLKAVTSPNKSLPFLIAASSELASPADLAGHSFGVGRVGSLDHSLSAKVLEAAGVDMDSLDILTLGQPNVRAQALAAGQVDATTISIGVWLALPDKDGLAVMIDQADYYAAAPVVSKVNVVSDQVLAERGDEVEKVVRALINISRDFSANPAAWAEAMAALTPSVSPDELAALADRFTGTWSVNGGMNAQELQYTQDWLYRTEDFVGAAPVQVSDWTDFSIVDKVLAEIGIDPNADQPSR